jgi:hypothetical protein
MPKKVKRQISRTITTAGMGPARNVAVEFNPDYSNTKRDLKRIGLLAGFFFIVLIVLKFVLP